MNKALAIALVAVICLSSRDAAAWDDFGHMQVAAVAYAKLNALAKKRAAELLKMNPRYKNWTGGYPTKDADRIAFVVAATWADGIKNDPAYTDDKPPTNANTPQSTGYADRFRHAYWHYVDRPFSPDGTALVQPVAPNLETQIHAFVAALSDPSVSDDAKSYELTWLLHLVGDAHQPLHCTSRFDAADPKGDAGGNAVQIQGNEQPSVCDDPRFCLKAPSNKLHIFFDDVTGDSCCATEALEAAKHLPAVDAHLGAIADESVWITEGFELAQSTVYVSPIGVGHGPFTIDAKYAAAAIELGRTRIALAGARLAKVLNAAFAAEKTAKAKTPTVPH